MTVLTGTLSRHRDVTRGKRRWIQGRPLNVRSTATLAGDNKRVENVNLWEAVYGFQITKAGLGVLACGQRR